MVMEGKISLGLESVRVITKNDPGEPVQYLRMRTYGVTSLNGEGGLAK
jgi:uncharacterized protein YebE (UPF0316 family)